MVRRVLYSEKYDIHMTHGHGQQCGDCLRDIAGWRGRKGEKLGQLQ